MREVTALAEEEEEESGEPGAGAELPPTAVPRPGRPKEGRAAGRSTARRPAAAPRARSQHGAVLRLLAHVKSFGAEEALAM